LLVVKGKDEKGLGLTGDGLGVLKEKVLFVVVCGFPDPGE